MRALRVHLGLHQETLANLIGVHRTIITHIEADKNKLTLAKQRRDIARALGLSYESLDRYLEGELSLKDLVANRPQAA